MGDLLNEHRTYCWGVGPVHLSNDWKLSATRWAVVFVALRHFNIIKDSLPIIWDLMAALFCNCVPLTILTNRHCCARHPESSCSLFANATSRCCCPNGKGRIVVYLREGLQVHVAVHKAAIVCLIWQLENFDSIIVIVSWCHIAVVVTADLGVFVNQSDERYTTLF